MRLVVTGDRNWNDLPTMWDFLDQLHKEYTIEVLIEGEQRGADVMAREWAKSRGVDFDPYPAAWTRYGKAAGPIRNQQMIDEGHPDHAAVFHKNLKKSKGTKDMVERISKANIPAFFITG